MMTLKETLDMLRPNIAGLKPYSSARNEFHGSNAILLDANENPYNPRYSMLAVNRYPDPFQRKAKEKIAGIKGVRPEQIFLGNGSDEAVDLIIRCFCEPSTDSIAIFTPTYGMYSVCAAINNVEVKQFLLNNDFSININQFFNGLSPNIKVVFICSPNNPSGNTQSLESIEQVVSRYRGIVVVDEAYIDFCPEKTSINLITRYPNIIVLQTFSKAWAMAGARIGVAFANQLLIDTLSKVKFPYNIGLPSLRILDKAIEKSSSSKIYINKIIDEREKVRLKLQKLPFVKMVYPSDSNFLLVKATDANAIYKHLLGNGIVVRNRSHEPLCENCLRITIGRPDENQKLMQTLITYQP